MEAATEPVNEAQEGQEAPQPAAVEEGVEYVIQRLGGLQADAGDAGLGSHPVYVDVGRVTVAPRSRRRTVLQAAIDQELINPEEPITNYRVLDPDSWKERPVGTEVETIEKKRVVIG